MLLLNYNTNEWDGSWTGQVILESVETTDTQYDTFDRQPFGQQRANIFLTSSLEVKRGLCVQMTCWVPSTQTKNIVLYKKVRRVLKT